MQSSEIVTEIVEIPLDVPFADFLRVFQLELLPVLLAEPGVLSVRTGVKIRASEKSTHAWAVSLTEWDSLKCHARFVKKETSAPFFEKAAKISRGPPTIDHYHFDNLKSLGTSECTRVVFEKYVSRGNLAASLDNEGLSCNISPVKVDTESFPSCAARFFDVLWYSCERKVLKPSL
ncbi:hypothetical protein BKA64DRAFT_24489 [Cadophora sp. MPI-SDFR-AT-0126]|nr:hypothetical protein BKA64DRAFT_24489 [Leotiomycetes sp. MPI-SDFR-AT-0126]